MACNCSGLLGSARSIVFVAGTAWRVLVRLLGGARDRIALQPQPLGGTLLKYGEIVIERLLETAGIDVGRRRVQRKSAPGGRTTVIIATEDHDRRAKGPRRSAGHPRRNPCLGPGIDPASIFSEQTNTAEALRPTRHCILMEGDAHRSVEVEVPGHDPMRVEGAHLSAGSPIGVVETGGSLVLPGSGRHRSPTYEPAAFVRSERLDAQRYQDRLGNIGQTPQLHRKRTIGGKIEGRPRDGNLDLRSNVVNISPIGLLEKQCAFLAELLAEVPEVSPGADPSCRKARRRCRRTILTGGSLSPRAGT
jgi:hypothetical protein